MRTTTLSEMESGETILTIDRILAGALPAGEGSRKGRTRAAKRGV